jgi:hypothetical protein
MTALTFPSRTNLTLAAGIPNMPKNIFLFRKLRLENAILTILPYLDNADDQFNQSR